MEIMVKVCADGEKPEMAGDMADMPAEPQMTPEEAVARFRELVKGTPKGMTAMQVQEELKKVLTIITGEEPEED
jgi:hypothetical protein